MFHCLLFLGGVKEDEPGWWELKLQQLWVEECLIIWYTYLAFQKETGWHQDEESNIVHHPDLEDAQLQTQNKIPQQLWQGRFQIRTLNRCDQWCFAISCKNTYLAVETY